MVSDHSRLVQANGTQTPLARSASSEPRRFTADDFNRAFSTACRIRDNWGSGFDGDRHEGTAPPLNVIVRDEIIAKHNIHPEDAAKLLEASERKQAKDDADRRAKRMQSLCERLGARFASATLDSYRIHDESQGKAVAAIRKYASAIKEHAAAGAGVVLFGAAGSGKTHLIAAVAKAAIEAGLTVEWRNGQDLFASFRNCITLDVSDGQIVDQLVEADVLVLDDLLPPGGTLSAYQATNLYRIVDARYCQCRPTMVSMNAASGDEASQGMGAQVADRLRDGALCLYCDWPSYRKAQA